MRVTLLLLALISVQFSQSRRTYLTGKLSLGFDGFGDDEIGIEEERTQEIHYKTESFETTSSPFEEGERHVYPIQIGKETTTEIRSETEIPWTSEVTEEIVETTTQTIKKKKKKRIPEVRESVESRTGNGPSPIGNEDSGLSFGSQGDSGNQFGTGRAPDFPEETRSSGFGSKNAPEFPGETVEESGLSFGSRKAPEFPAEPEVPSWDSEYKNERKAAGVKIIEKSSPIGEKKKRKRKQQKRISEEKEEERVERRRIEMERTEDQKRKERLRERQEQLKRHFAEKEAQHIAEIELRDLEKRRMEETRKLEEMKERRIKEEELLTKQKEEERLEQERKMKLEEERRKNEEIIRKRQEEKARKETERVELERAKEAERTKEEERRRQMELENLERQKKEIDAERIRIEEQRVKIEEEKNKMLEDERAFLLKREQSRKKKTKKRNRKLKEEERQRSEEELNSQNKSDEKSKMIKQEEILDAAAAFQAKRILSMERYREKVQKQKRRMEEELEELRREKDDSNEEKVEKTKKDRKKKKKKLHKMREPVRIRMEESTVTQDQTTTVASRTEPIMIEPTIKSKTKITSRKIGLNVQRIAGTESSSDVITEVKAIEPMLVEEKVKEFTEEERKAQEDYLKAYYEQYYKEWYRKHNQPSVSAATVVEQPFTYGNAGVPGPSQTPSLPPSPPAPPTQAGNFYGIVDPRLNGSEISKAQLDRMCIDIKNTTRAFGIRNAKGFAENNCSLIKMYYQAVTCEQISHVMEYCEPVLNARRRK